jgi:hypothetical protein
MEFIAIKQRLDALEAALAKLLKQPIPEPSIVVPLAEDEKKEG